MPQRFLRPGLRNSSRWNSVSRTAQVLYVGLLTLVDDYGQFDGRASVIHGECFSVWNELHADNPQESAATRCALQELAAARMIDIWENEEGKLVLEVTQWQERVREGAKRKWGLRRNPQESAADCSVPQRNPASPAPAPASTSSPPPPPVPPPNTDLLRVIEEIYQAYPRKVGKPDALKAIAKSVKKISSEELLRRTQAFAVAQIGGDPQFCPHPSTWFNQERFNDDPATWVRHHADERAHPQSPGERRDSVIYQ